MHAGFGNCRPEYALSFAQISPCCASGHEPVQLTTGPMSFGAPAPSLDGKRIFAIGEQSRGELVRYDAKFGQFVPFLSGISAAGVSFSLDGKWVTYSEYPDQNLWRSRAGGSDKLQLTYKPFFALMPRWSPDGKQIVFAGADPGRNLSLYIISAQGGASQSLLERERDVFFPNWTPDGKSIIFEEAADGEPNIFSLDMKTRQVSTLPGSKNLIAPAISPDGSYLAAATSDRQK
jgi:eukaryotic-like serine/threonine-protein kinase